MAWLLDLHTKNLVPESHVCYSSLTAESSANMTEVNLMSTIKQTFYFNDSRPSNLATLSQLLTQKQAGLQINGMPFRKKGKK